MEDFHLAGKMSTKTFWMKLPSNRHLQKMFAGRVFETAQQLKKLLPSPPSHHRNITKKYLKKQNSPSFKKKYNWRKTFPCLTWRFSFFLVSSQDALNLELPLVVAKVGHTTMKCPPLRKWKIQRKKICEFWWFGFSERKQEKRRLPRSKHVGKKNI